MEMKSDSLTPPETASNQADDRPHAGFRPFRICTCLLFTISTWMNSKALDANAFGSLGSTEDLDYLWSHATLYSGKDNPVLQKLSFTGRFQYEYTLVDGEGSPSAGVWDNDLDYDDWNTRRWRMGFKATMFHDFTLHAEADLDPDVDTMYQRLTDASISWAPCDNFKLTLGKQGLPFTLDGATSSKELLTIDRNNLSNNLWFPTEYFTGLAADVTTGPWLFKAGVFSSGEVDKEFGDLEGGWSWLASAGYDLKECLGAEQAQLKLDYVYQEEDPLNDGTRALSNVGSLNFQWQDGPWGFRSDLAAGDGYNGQSDLWGLVLMPFYNINDHLQLVFRYTYIESDRADGLRLARYENLPTNALRGNANNGRGDEYQEFYLGLNWYLHGNKLKLQTGIQYATMEDSARNGGDYEGWSWTTGMRVSW